MSWLDAQHCVGRPRPAHALRHGGRRVAQFHNDGAIRRMVLLFAFGLWWLWLVLVSCILLKRVGRLLIYGCCSSVLRRCVGVAGCVCGFHNWHRPATLLYALCFIALRLTHIFIFLPRRNTVDVVLPLALDQQRPRWQAVRFCCRGYVVARLPQFVFFH